jgi:cephalosporin-C deacetylase
MQTPQTVYPDFDRFWAHVTREVFAVPTGATVRIEPNWDSPHVRVEHVTLASSDNIRIHAWLFTPKRAEHGTLLYLPGYSASSCTGTLMRIYQQIASFGFVLLALDPRGQGASRAVCPPHPVGKLLTGIASPTTHMYRGILADCVQGVRFLAERTGAPRIGVGGHSQGAGLALMTASLVPDLVGSVTAMIPFLTGYRYHVTRQHSKGPYSEITAYLQAHPEQSDHVLRVLDYFDTLSHANRITAPSLLSVALMDATCLPASIHSLKESLVCTNGLLTFPDAGHENLPHFYHHVVQWHRYYLSSDETALDELRL